LTDECLLRARDAELVSLRIGQDGPGFSAGLPDVGPARPEGKKAAGLLLAVGGAAGQVELHAVLDHLAIGDWQEAPAGRRRSGGPGDDRALAPGKNPPAKRLGPQPGQSRQVVRVRGHAGRHATRNRDA
jgi:hypothetical protein